MKLQLYVFSCLGIFLYFTWFIFNSPPNSFRRYCSVEMLWSWREGQWGPYLIAWCRLNLHFCIWKWMFPFQLPTKPSNSIVVPLNFLIVYFTLFIFVLLKHWALVVWWQLCLFQKTNFHVYNWESSHSSISAFRGHLSIQLRLMGHMNTLIHLEYKISGSNLCHI